MTRPGFQRVGRVSVAAAPSYTMPVASYVIMIDAVDYTDGGVGSGAIVIDRSGNGYNLTTNVESFKPAKGTDSHGTYMQSTGGDVLGYSDGSYHGINSANPFGYCSLAIIAVFQPSLPSQDGVLCSLDGDVFHRDAYFSQTDNAKQGWTWESYYYYGQNTYYATTTPSIVSYEWLGSSYDVGTITCRINGYQVWSDNASGSAYRVGAFRQFNKLSVFGEARGYPSASIYGSHAGTRLYYWSMWIIPNTGDASGTIRQAERFLGNRYGVTIP